MPGNLCKANYVLQKNALGLCSNSDVSLKYCRWIESLLFWKESDRVEMTNKAHWPHLVLLVVVYEGEGEWYVEGVGFVRGGCAFARLEGDHQVDVSSRTVVLEGVDEILSKYRHQHLFKLQINTWNAKHKSCHPAQKRRSFSWAQFLNGISDQRRFVSPDKNFNKYA